MSLPLHAVDVGIVSAARLLLILATAAAIAAVGRAQVVIVNWGGAYVSAQSALARVPAAGSNFGNVGGTATLDSRRLLAFSEEVPLNPITGYTGVSSEFFGGATWIRHDGGVSPAAGFTRVSNNGATDAITFRLDGPSSGFPVAGEGYGLVLWQDHSFLNTGGNPVAFGSQSSVSITLTTANIGEVRWVVRNGEAYYVSESSFTASTMQSDPTAIRWAAYDPATSLSFVGTDFSLVTMQNLTGVGLYFGNNGITWNSSIDGAPRIDIEAFTVTATLTAIPEPSTNSLIAGALVLLGSFWRMRRALQNPARPEQTT